MANVLSFFPYRSLWKNNRLIGKVLPLIWQKIQINRVNEFYIPNDYSMKKEKVKVGYIAKKEKQRWEGRKLVDLDIGNLCRHETRGLLICLDRNFVCWDWPSSIDRLLHADYRRYTLSYYCSRDCRETATTVCRLLITLSKTPPLHIPPQLTMTEVTTRFF